jgi:hypothetical protein
MIVWVLIITVITSASMDAGVSVTVIDSIASAESCEQLAKVVRSSARPDRGGVMATCAPVRKVRS